MKSAVIQKKENKMPYIKASEIETLNKFVQQVKKTSTDPATQTIADTVLALAEELTMRHKLKNEHDWAYIKMRRQTDKNYAQNRKKVVDNRNI